MFDTSSSLKMLQDLQVVWFGKNMKSIHYLCLVFFGILYILYSDIHRIQGQVAARKV